jgi:exopolysaccharide/PEP-CTERM locus tyrosine autokinase
MSSLIEQAALRMEQLRQAGVEVPEMVSHEAPGVADSSALASPPAQPGPQAAAAAVQPAAFVPAAPVLPRPLPSPFPGAVGRAVDWENTTQSRRVEIDLVAIGAAGIVTPNSPRSQMADQYRVIKRPLIANAVGRGAATVSHGNLIMVTSALPGEGKSFTSLNLAMSIASELDHTVMLVDADVARPSLLRMLGLPPGPGLLDLLEGKADMANVLLRTNVDKLTILPSGSPHAKATELLASDAMSHLLEDMATRYPDRIIIFDSPPLLLTTESRVLATHMGQIVVVVQADQTLQSDVQQALAAIESCPVKMMVLNKARADAPGSYGGYGGYGYGYGENYGESYGENTAYSNPARGRAAPGGAPGVGPSAFGPDAAQPGARVKA